MIGTRIIVGSLHMARNAGDRGGAYMEWVLTAVLIAVFTLLAVKFLGAENSASWGDVSASFSS